MPPRRSADVDVVAVVALALLLLHGSGIAPTGLLGAVLLTATVGHRVGGRVATGAPLGPDVRASARRVAPLLIAFTLGCSLQARLTGDADAYSALRGSVTWVWLGFADVHALVWRAGGWEPGTFDPSIGTAVVAAAARPAVLWLLVGMATRGDVALQRRIAQVALACCAAAAVVWLPGGDDARRYFSPELTTAAALGGVLVATAGGSLGASRPPTVRLPLPVDGDLLLLSSFLWLTPVFGALAEVDDGPALLLLALVALVAPALATALAADGIGSSSASNETLAVLLPPAAVLALLALWQATGAFGYAPPAFV